MALFGQRRSTADDLMESIRRFQQRNPPDRRPTLGELTEASRAMTGRNRPQRPSVLDAPRVDGPPIRRPQATATSYTPTVSERIGGMFGRAVGSREAGNSLASLLADWTPIGNVDGVMRDPTLNSLEAQLSVLPLPGPVRRGVGAGVNALTDRIRAYHGSPHDFDRFDMSRIGTGEGAQAYGHGLYFAENENVARQYRDVLGYKHTNGAPDVDWDRPEAVAGRTLVDAQRDPEAAVAELARKAQMFREEANRWRSSPAIAQQSLNNAASAEAAIAHVRSGTHLEPPNPGHMYEVNINADPNSLLDWDIPVEDQADLADRILPNRVGHTGQLISDFADSLGAFRGDPAGRARAAQELANRGIPGIRYLDAGSRSAGDGSRNYVIFDDSLIEIMRKYGLGGLMGAGVAGAAATQGGEPERPIY